MAMPRIGNPAAEPRPTALSAAVLLDRRSKFVRDEYIRYRTVLAGGAPYQPGPQWDGFRRRGPSGKVTVRAAVWPVIAELTIRQDINPRRLIHTCGMKHVRTLLRPAYPNWYLSQMALDWYFAVQRTEEDDVRAELANNKLLFRTEIDYRMQFYQWPFRVAAQAVVLAAPEVVALTNLFRYCLAVDLGMEAAAKEFEASALFCYSMMPRSYDLVWEELVPAPLRQIVQKQRTLLGMKG